YELMISCWHYIPENRINFRDIHSRLDELLLDNNKEQPTIWFSNETTSETVTKQIFILY
ncbi:unnamed protein product, partial [Adineta steineri]